MDDMLSVTVKKIIGQPNPKGGKWSGVLDVEPPERHLRKTRGRLFAVLDLTGSSTLDLAGFGQQALEILRRHYYEVDGDSPFKALEAAVKKAQRRLVELVFGPGAAAIGALDYNFAVCSLWGKVLYIAKLGSASIYLYRRGVLKELGQDRSEKVFMASGMVEPEDSLVLGTNEFRNSFTLSDFPKSDYDLQAQIRDLGSPPGVSVLVLTFNLEAVPGEEEIVHIEPVPKSRRLRRFLKPLGLGLLAASFLLGSVYTIRKRQSDFRAAEAARLLGVAEERLADARSYVDLNNLRARELLLSAQNGFEAVDAVGGEVLGLEQKFSEIAALLDQVNKIKRVRLEQVEGELVNFDPLSELNSPPERDGSIVDAGTYLGNVYFLNPSKNQIFKYVPVEEEYSLPQEWIKEEVNLSDAVSLAVDGFVYVLKSAGQVFKFEKGERLADFRLKGLDQPLSDPQAIFTTIESEHLYILDVGHKRIVVFDKNGLYQSQYVYEDGVGPTDLFVDETPGFIYLTDGISLYRIDI